jgi:hypothetical protein
MGRLLVEVARNGTATGRYSKKVATAGTYVKGWAAPAGGRAVREKAGG